MLGEGEQVRGLGEREQVDEDDGLAALRGPAPASGSDTRRGSEGPLSEEPLSDPLPAALPSPGGSDRTLRQEPPTSHHATGS